MNELPTEDMVREPVGGTFEDGSQQLADFFDVQRETLLAGYRSTVTAAANTVATRAATVDHSGGTTRRACADVAIEQALSQAVALISSALTEHRGGDHSWLELADNDEAMAVSVKELLRGAEHEAVCVAAPTDLADGPLQAVAEALQEPDGAGAKMRVLLPIRDTERHRIRTLIPDAARRRVRLTKVPLQKMVVVDRRTALVVSRLGPDRRQALMIGNPAILKTLCALFADSWGAAAPLRPVPMLDDPRQRETTRLILAALRDGQKDDVAARELGMSVRTYRRYVADFMRDVDATSRFQAGVRAAQLRLLPTD